MQTEFSTYLATTNVCAKYFESPKQDLPGTTLSRENKNAP